MKPNQIRTIDVIRYVKPLREGGSLPAIVEGSDGFHYVLKFRGAGQGKKALIAELIGGELARTIDLNVPELVFMNLDESFSKAEGDEEIQDLLKFSVGLNLGLHFLSGAITYDPLVTKVDGFSASKVVLLDAVLSNIDRTAKNTNLLIWHKELWLIDHGASLYFHHNWSHWKSHLRRTFPMVKDHVLLEQATELKKAGDFIKSTISKEDLEAIVRLVPEEWLVENGDILSPIEKRQAYVEVLFEKVRTIDSLVKEAENAK